MSYAYPTPLCEPDELKALTAMFKGNATAAGAFCDKLSTRVGGIEEGVNTFFMTVMGALVFIMHAGFAMVRMAYQFACVRVGAAAAAAAVHSDFTVGCSGQSNAFEAAPPHCCCSAEYSGCLQVFQSAAL